jgi:hypothetical protein
MRRLPLLAAAVAGAVLLAAPAAQADPSQFALASASASLSTHEAGAHPDLFTEFEVATDPTSEANGFGLKRPYAVTRDVHIGLPPGLIGNPNAVTQCTVAELEAFAIGGGCPNASQVGVVKFYAYALTQAFTEPIYMMHPPADESAVARLGFVGALFPIYIDARLRSEADYGIEASVERASAEQEVVRVETTLWGVPAAKAHDTERQTPIEAYKGATSSPPRPPGGIPAPFMTNPTRCGKPLEMAFAADSYQLPGQFSEVKAPLGTITGCDQISFDPTLSLTPSSRQAAEPTGLDAELTLPQNETEGGHGTSEMRYATVTLPAGMTIASGAGDGLAACSAQEVGFERREASHCPGAAKIGSGEIESPALSRPIEASVYQRTPVKGDLFGVWLVADELGLHLKLPGEVHVDGDDGQITTSFTEGTPQTEGLPQAPVSRFTLRFKSGPRAPLAAPRACGTYFAHYQFVPWSGRPAREADVPMTFDQGCSTGGFDPKLTAGSTNPLAGAFSQFLTTLTFRSGEQNPSGLELTLPRGVLAKLAGIPLCEGANAQDGTCAAASRVGGVNVAAGPGPRPLWLPQPGKEAISVYLSGPYKGAPYSLVVRTPVQAGPFDLGTVVTRAAVYVDPETALVTVRSDPLPQILEGVPISYRTIHVAVDRHEFALNPTSCAEKRVRATLTSSEGAAARPSSRFQVGGCRELPFKPKLSLRLFGKTNRGAHPRLKAVLTARKGDANLSGAQVTLPRSEFIENAHFRTICTRVQFAAHECPAGSVYGHVKAMTPLLSEPLEGPVYLRSSSHQLPDLVIALKGQIEFNATARVDSANGGIRTTFEDIPDAPLTKVIVNMQGGAKSLFVNSTNLCKSTSRSPVKLIGQNGKRETLRTDLKNGCETGAVSGKSHHTRKH